MNRDALIRSLKTLSGALLDAYTVVDTDQQILEFNRSFYAIFPKSVARKLTGTPLGDVLTLELNRKPIDLAAECMHKQAALRYDQLIGRVRDGDSVHLIGAASPLTDGGEPAGAFLSFRDVTDEAQVQMKYKGMLEQEARQRQQLERRLREVESELVGIKDQLNAVEEELRDYKRGLLI